MASAPSQKKVLYISHNHPEIRPGGAEAYALQLYEGVRDAGEFDALFLARSGPPVSVGARTHEGRPVTLVNDDPHQYFFYTDLSDWDWLYGRSPNKAALTRFYSQFLLDHAPDIVHLQHTLFLGYDILRVTRNVLPQAPILYTIHEYLPICFHDGKMVRTQSFELCSEASPRRCHECFPQVTQQDFFMRERFIKSHLGLVDLFVAPSRFALERFVDWGIPRSKILYEPHGNLPGEPVPERKPPPARNRFGFFGQMTQYKGIDVVLKAVAALNEEVDVELVIHGANLEWAPADYQDALRALLQAAGDSVTIVGSYEPHELPSLMADIDWVVVPSIWWENAPLVIQEAFQCGRPVICSDIGGMAEKVADKVDGLHFRTGDPDSLAAVMRRAATDRALWEKLSGGIRPVHTMADHVSRLGEAYRSLLAERGAPTAGRSRVVEHV